MLTSDTKRHIDSARQILVGVVPNPTSQIDQITNALIYKFMDDMDQAAIKTGGKPSFFVDNLEQYAWTRIMDTRLGNQERMNLYTEALSKFSEAKQLPELFRGIFKSAFLPYRSPETLGLFLKEIDYFDYSHPEELGNAYEYLLSIMSSQGDAGQFRTPRHIIDFIVDVVNPTKDDKVLDPACGTGGFLISAYKHIIEQHDGKDDPGKKEKPLSADDRKKMMQNFEGYDIDPGMVRIAQVNMYLHQFKNPKIVQYDSLSMDERWGDKFDVILANPPFMSPKGGIRPHNKFSIQASKSEVLFVDYIVNHLKPKGRAGIIVPEGIIFQSGNAYKQLRKKLVEDGLYAVVSLPSGVFNPYSGVKTSILFFDNDLSKRNSEMVFVKVEQDGFDLGAQRRAGNKNDLIKALDILNKFRVGEKVEDTIVAYVEKSKIAENADYNLSGDRYRIATDYTNTKWSMVELSEVCNLESGSRQKGGAIDSGVYSIGGEQISKDNEIRFEKMKYITEEHFSEMRKGILFKGDVLMVKDGATTGKMGFWNYDYRAAVNEHVFIFRSKDKIIPKYLYNVLLSDSFQYELKPYIKGIISGISLEIKKIEIPLPPLEIQEQIVSELDGYQKIVDGAKQIVANWKPMIDIDPEWKRVRLGDVCMFIDYRGKTPQKTISGVPLITAKNIKKGYINENPKEYITEEDYDSWMTRGFPKTGDVLITTEAPLGNVAIVDASVKFALAQRVINLSPKSNDLIGAYLMYVLLSKELQDILSNNQSGSTVYGIKASILKTVKIPMPSFEIQQQIVKEIKVEEASVESAKKLIEIYEKKTKEVISKLWEE